MKNICIKCGVDLYAAEGRFVCQKHPKECKGIILPKETLQEWADKEKQKQHLIDMMKADEELGLYEEKTKCYCGHTTYCDCGPEEPKQEITLEEHNYLQGFINQFEEEGEYQELSNDDWTVSRFLEWLKHNNFKIIKNAN